MEYRRINPSEIEPLWKLQKAYKAEIGEETPSGQDRDRLLSAVQNGQIMFFGAFDGTELIGCCSVTVGFSTFNYAPSGVFEDFYICPAYRHKGVARELVQLAYRESGVVSLTVGCADCDVSMYRSLGFRIPIGNLFAFDGESD